MSELFLSSNNLSIGDEELKCILTFLNISRDELIKMILDKTFTFYYNIEYYSYNEKLKDYLVRFHLSKSYKLPF